MITNAVLSSRNKSIHHLIFVAFQGSLSSLSFTDIYGTPSTQPEGVNLADLHRRVEILLQVC